MIRCEVANCDARLALTGSVEQGDVPCYGKDVMGKITSKYQVTLPKAIAERYNVRPGDTIDWVAAEQTGIFSRTNKYYLG